MAPVSEVFVCDHLAPFAFRLQQNIEVEGHGKESSFPHSSQEAGARGEEEGERGGAWDKTQPSEKNPVTYFLQLGPTFQSSIQYKLINEVSTAMMQSLANSATNRRPSLRYLLLEGFFISKGTSPGLGVEQLIRVK